MPTKALKKIRVAINGCGRIGRAFLKIAWTHPEIEIVAVNDLGSIDNIAYLLKYDTSYRKNDLNISAEQGTEPALIIDGKKVAYVSERDATKLPWKKYDIDVVVESTGLFTSYEKARVHLSAGAKKVVITAPAKDEPLKDISSATILLGINEDKFKTCVISSNASCTTNAASPLLAILHESLGIEKAILNTVHGYTASQSLVDSPNAKDFGEGRAAAMN